MTDPADDAASSQTIGFIGLGTMGEPMALNLVRSGASLLVWNRSAERCGLLEQAGACVAANAAEVFLRCGTIFLMLSDERATDVVLGRQSALFSQQVKGRRIVSMGTFQPAYSAGLAKDIAAAGGCYIEAPVSGSRFPAETGQLVAMLAGEPVDIVAVRPLLASMCRESFDCGLVPGALRMKLAVNLFLVTLVTGLVEATHFAQRHGLDLERFAAILGAGPMASDVSKAKSDKLLHGDFSRQASICDVLKNSSLVFEAAREASVASPLLDVCQALYRETEALGWGDLDMIAVIRAIEGRSDRVSSAAAAPSL